MDGELAFGNLHIALHFVDLETATSSDLVWPRIIRTMRIKNSTLNATLPFPDFLVWPFLDNHLIFSLTSALASFLFLGAQFLEISPRFIYSVDHYELEYFLGGNILWTISHFGFTCCCKTPSFLKLFILSESFSSSTQMSHTNFCGFLTGGQRKCCQCCLGLWALSHCSGTVHWGPESQKPKKLWQQLKVWLALSPCQIQRLLCKLCLVSFPP